jgi:uncharacterized protein YodC (DUF2158 family)
MKNIVVMPIGTKVSLGHSLEEAIDAVITSVCIKQNNYVTYECSWWSGRSNETGWFHETQFLNSDNVERTKIGFGR